MADFSTTRTEAPSHRDQGARSGQSGQPGSEDTGAGEADQHRNRASGRADNEDETTTAALLWRLIDDMTSLVRKEAALAASELSAAVHDARRGVTSLAAGGAVLYAGLLFLLLAATLSLAEVMPAWGAAFIVGTVVAVIGLVMFQAGKKKTAPGHFAPDRAANAARKDSDMIKRQSNDAHK